MLAGTYLRIFSDCYEDPDGEPGAIFSVGVQEVRAACWDLPWDAP
jgi:hypothetical protein